MVFIVVAKIVIPVSMQSLLLTESHQSICTRALNITTLQKLWDVCHSRKVLEIAGNMNKLYPTVFCDK